MLDADLARVVKDVRTVRSPAARAWQATRVLALDDELRTIRRDAVLELRAHGESWSEIAWLLQISRARAWQLGRSAA